VSSTPTVLYRRFDRYQRLMHGVMMLSFLGLAYTGLPLLFHDACGRYLRGSSAVSTRRASCTDVRCMMIGVFSLHVMQLLHRRTCAGNSRSCGAPRRSCRSPAT
jgi:cytochrome b subunit of formate dehydrogenase